MEGEVPGISTPTSISIQISTSPARSEVVSEEERFEAISLQDGDRTITSDQLANSSAAFIERGLDASTDTSTAATSQLDRELVADSSMDTAVTEGVMKESVSSSTTIPLEFTHFVDSAIMGAKESVERLQELVTVGNDIARSVVDALLAAMGGVEGLDESGVGRDDSSSPSVMHNSCAAIVAVELIPWLPCYGDSGNWMSPRTRMVKGLLCILRSCTRNRAICSSLGLLGLLLHCVEKLFAGLHSTTSGWDSTPLCQCIETLAGHSLSVHDLHNWLILVKKTITTEWAMQLLLSLEKAIGGKEARGPSCTFEFDGESSGLLGPGESKWPFSNGYSFATWIYIESFEDTLNTATAAASIAAAAAAKSGKSSPMSAAAAASVLAGEGTAHMPRLFSFLSPENLGVEAYFHGQFLVVECVGGKGKKASLHFTHAFKPQCWYFVGLEHTCKQGLIGKTESELRLYVDGSLYERQPFEFPRVSKPLAFCCIGTNPPPTMAGLQRRRRQCPLFAEMGPVYIFKEPIGQERMARLAVRGGDTLPCFGNGAGFPCLGIDGEMKKVAEESFKLDAEIGGSLHLLYHPCLLSGRFCPDASLSGASGMHRRPAEVLGQVYVASRKRASTSLWALACGGPMVLLPLAVSKLQGDSLEPVLGGSHLSLATCNLSASIFRIISMSVEHPGNNEELRRIRAPEVLSKVLYHLLQTMSTVDVATGKQSGVSDEELVASIISLCQSQNKNHELKVQLFRTLLLDLKIWSTCNYVLQKKLLSSLSDMVFTETSAMHDANAVQMLLDGCRKCYWIIREKDSVNTFSLKDLPRPVGEINALVDELLVIIELLIGVASPPLATNDVRRLIGFLVDCPQPNQVAKVLHLIYRLVVQPNTSRAHVFAESFISSGGIETLLVLLQKEEKTGNHNILEGLKSLEKDTMFSGLDSTEVKAQTGDLQLHNENNSQGDSQFVSPRSCEYSKKLSTLTNIEGAESSSVSQFSRNVGGTSSLISDGGRSNAYNSDNGDGILVGIINLVGALVTSGHLKFSSAISSSNYSSTIQGSGGTEDDGIMYNDNAYLLLFALQKAFQAAPQRLMTTNVYTALMGATMNVTSADDGLNLYDSSHHFEHLQLLLVLLRSLPYAPRSFQVQAIQDLLFLACSHPENRSRLTCMEEWPEWILEVLISNYELQLYNINFVVRRAHMGSGKQMNDPKVEDIEDLIHNFLIIVLEHSMRQKDGWKDVEATIHCAEWLSMVGGSSAGDLRIRREESLPIFRRRLLGSLLDFASRELQVQTQVIASAAAGVASEHLSPQEAKIEAENVAQLSVALAENAVVILMLVEDHLRLQGQHYISSHPIDDSKFASPASTTVSHSSALGKSAGEMSNTSFSRKNSTPSDSAGLPLDVLASMADANGQISAVVMERLSAAVAAEPYESVRCAFVSYGSCGFDLMEGWKFRSRMWYGVGLPPKTDIFGGGGSGLVSWKYSLEKDSNGDWIELSLVKKSITMLQALLLDVSSIGGGLGAGGGSGTGMGGMTALYQLLDSDQPFLCMLRMVLVSMREDDIGEEERIMRNISIKQGISEGLCWHAGNVTPVDNHNCMSTRRPCSALIWSVLAPILNMPISESKRQRVLVTSCILYSEVWHAIGRDRKPIRKKYLEAILPPFIAILRKWRPLLAGVHELTSSDGQNPLIVDDRCLAAETLPIEAALLMISPGWAAAFASPPAAMALAMIAAGVAGGETVSVPTTSGVKHDTSLRETKMSRLYTFSSFKKSSEPPKILASIPKDRAAAKASALSAARHLERLNKIGTGRGLSAVAMATSAQRRAESDTHRAKRWNISEAMRTGWTECLQSVDAKPVSGKDFSALSNKFVSVLVSSFALARNMQRIEMDRRAQDDLHNRHRAFIGSRTWRKFIHYLLETNVLYSAFADNLCNPKKVFWKLDVIESSSRMRHCFKRNYKGSDHSGLSANYIDHYSQYEPQKTAAGHTTETEDPFETTLPPTSVLTEEAISLKETNEDYEPVEIGIVSDSTDNQQNRLSDTAEQSVQEVLGQGHFDSDSNQNLLQTTSAADPYYVLGDPAERVIFELSSSIVLPLKVVKGTFQITSKRINFVIDENYNENIIEECTTSTSQKKVREKDRSWSISSLHQIFSRRYLLRRSALELFMVDRSNFFFDFGSIEGRRNAYRAIVQTRPPLLNNIYMATQRPDQLLRRTQLMERWSRWEISNFEYLMELNTLAGRSYNDITQYPVFPWILADYNSSNLDLENPSSYRDLSKPIGALNTDRLKKFQERYSSFEDPVIPKFHYGSHYSSAGTILYYLVRVEPYTTLSIQLQGGKFDHADRMFSDIGATWDGVLEDMSDVKELVPELFYLPEVLTNVNSVDFGTTQNEEKIDSVKLPRWAENPVDFIHKHRMALESEHVSAHLHEWIDLIFGYKQRGKEAISAHNVFFYITYEGTVDIDKISDPVQQRAAQDQIAYFGQTPSQLLTIPHLKKKPLGDILHLQTIFRNPNEIKTYVVPNSERCNVPAAAICASQDSVIIVDINAPSANVVFHKWQPNTPDGHGTPFLFQHGRAAANSTGGAFMRMFKGHSGSNVEDWQFSQALAFSASGITSSSVVAITSDKDIITGGHADNSIKLISSDGAKTIETAAGHCAPVTCLALSKDSNYLVTGSRDATIILWRIHRIVSSQLNDIPNSSLPAKSSAAPITGGGIINSSSDNNLRRHIEGPMHVLRGHLGEIVCCCVSSDLGIIVSSSYISGVLLHSLRRGRFIRKICTKEAQAICLSPQGVIMTWSKDEQKLCTFTVNGIPIATSSLQSFSGRITCMEVSDDGENVLIGTGHNVTNNEEKEIASETSKSEEVESQSMDMAPNQSFVSSNRMPLHVPSICFINMHSLKVFHTLDFEEGQDITAIALNKDNTNLLVSTADKKLIIFTDPTLSLRVVDQMLRLGWEGDGLTPFMK